MPQEIPAFSHRVDSVIIYIHMVSQIYYLKSYGRSELSIGPDDFKCLNMES